MIVPIKKGEFHLGECLSAIASSEGVALEIVLVLDGWDSISFRKSNSQLHSQLRIFSLPKSGPAACRNFGAKQSNSEFICFIDSDVLVSKALFSKALHRLKTSGDDGLIGSYDLEPSAKSAVSRFRNLFHHYHHQINDGKKGVFWGAFGMIRKEVFEKAGGFDETFAKASIEDVELGIRLANLGYTVRIQADLEVKHLKHWTFFSWMKTDILLRAKPWTFLVLENNSIVANHLNTRNEEKISAIVALLLWIATFGLPFSIYFGLFFLLFGLLFIIFQQKFYLFALKNFKNILLVFFFHQLYFLFAMTGFALGCIDFTSKKFSKSHAK